MSTLIFLADLSVFTPIVLADISVSLLIQRQLSAINPEASTTDRILYRSYNFEEKEEDIATAVADLAGVAASCDGHLYVLVDEAVTVTNQSVLVF